MKVQATYVARRNGMASKGLKMAYGINAKGPHNGGQWRAMAGKAYAIGKEKARTMAGLVVVLVVVAASSTQATALTLGSRACGQLQPAGNVGGR